jgi:hypothetical protein
MTVIDDRIILHTVYMVFSARALLSGSHFGYCS